MEPTEAEKPSTRQMEIYEVKFGGNFELPDLPEVRVVRFVASSASSCLFLISYCSAPRVCREQSSTHSRMFRSIARDSKLTFDVHDVFSDLRCDLKVGDQLDEVVNRVD